MRPPVEQSPVLLGATGKRLLHIFPSFGIGGVPLRMCRIINHFGKWLSHTVIALDGNFGATRELSPEVDVKFLGFSKRKSSPLRAVFASARMLRLIRPDLLLTYNWGSIEWAIASRLVSVAGHIHFEAGFGKEEADRQIWRRVVCRRWALAECARVVVPSQQLNRLAQRSWRLPARMLLYLPNGVDVSRFSALARDPIPTFTRKPDELVVGTIAPLRPEKNIGRLLEAFARLDNSIPSRLIVAGDGVERAMLQSRSEQLGISERVTFTGLVQPEAVLGTFDVFALSSDTEQMPNALLEAMAASLPIAAVDVGDVRSMVSEENQPFIVPRDEQALAKGLEALLRDAAVRQRLARANFDRVVTHFSLDRMLAQYSELFGTALSTPRYQ
jgi:glycosyltransferase involved in cell wall biosynthesis